MSFARFLPLLLACCAAPNAVPEDPKPADAASKPTSTVEDDAIAAAEAQALLARRYYELALRQRDAGDDERASQSVQRALMLAPNNQEYGDLAFGIAVDLAQRPATVELVAQEAVAREAARREEELLTLRRLLAKAREATDREDWEAARRTYERARFVLRTSRYREDREFEALSAELRGSAEQVPESERARDPGLEKRLAR